MTEINPQESRRAEAYALWLHAPMPMLTFFKTLDVSRLLRYSRRKGLKFNMLMCWCVGKAASGIEEFYTLPVGEKLIRYDSLAVNTIVLNREEGINSCDVPFSPDLAQFNRDYLSLTAQVRENCQNHDIEDSMAVGTSALAQYDIDGAVGMYSGIFNNPFTIWSRYRRSFFRTTLTVSFQFHHTQMDGAHAALFLNRLQAEIKGLK